MHIMDPNIFGTSGAVIVLAAFLLNQTKRLTTESFTYDFLNFIGSVVLLIYAITIASYPFVAINIIWGGFSLKDVIVKLLKGKRIKFKI